MVAIWTRRRALPGPYRCPKGGSHQWRAKKTSRGEAYKECAKCGQKRPG